MKIACFLVEPVEGNDRLWRAPDGVLYHLGTMTDGVPPTPVGSMWDATWMTGLRLESGRTFGGVDGRTLVVRTPGGDWIVDGPSFSMGRISGPGWTRTGEPPKITVTPSIIIGNYHGWLREGFLIDA